MQRRDGPPMIRRQNATPSAVLGVVRTPIAKHPPNQHKRCLWTTTRAPPPHPSPFNRPPPICIPCDDEWNEFECVERRRALPKPFFSPSPLRGQSCSPNASHQDREDVSFLCRQLSSSARIRKEDEE
jgi:hypothetical protein